MNIVIIGPQGSGKGTQAKLLAERMGFYHLETGKMLRELAERDEKVNELINVKGELYPDEDTLKLIDQELKRQGVSKKGSKVFDGYPRTVRQYKLLKEWLAAKGQKLDMVIFVDISERETIGRLSARRTCARCGKVFNLITNPPPLGKCPCGGELVQREDDKPETLKKRIELYKRETLPIVEEAREDGLLLKVDGERPIEEIYADIGRYIVSNE